MSLPNSDASGQYNSVFSSSSKTHSKRFGKLANSVFLKDNFSENTNVQRDFNSNVVCNDTIELPLLSPRYFCSRRESFSFSGSNISSTATTLLTTATINTTSYNFTNNNNNNNNNNNSANSDNNNNSANSDNNNVSKNDVISGGNVNDVCFGSGSGNIEMPMLLKDKILLPITHEKNTQLKGGVKMVMVPSLSPRDGKQHHYISKDIFGEKGSQDCMSLSSSFFFSKNRSYKEISDSFDSYGTYTTTEITNCMMEKKDGNNQVVIKNFREDTTNSSFFSSINTNTITNNNINNSNNSNNSGGGSGVEITQRIGTLSPISPIHATLTPCSNNNSEVLCETQKKFKSLSFKDRQRLGTMTRFSAKRGGLNLLPRLCAEEVVDFVSLPQSPEFSKLVFTRASKLPNFKCFTQGSVVSGNVQNTDKLTTCGVESGLSEGLSKNLKPVRQINFNYCKLPSSKSNKIECDNSFVSFPSLKQLDTVMDFNFTTYQQTGNSFRRASSNPETSCSTFHTPPLITHFSNILLPPPPQQQQQEQQQQPLSPKNFVLGSCSVPNKDILLFLEGKEESKNNFNKIYTSKFMAKEQIVSKEKELLSAVTNTTTESIFLGQNKDEDKLDGDKFFPKFDLLGICRCTNKENKEVKLDVDVNNNNNNNVCLKKTKNTADLHSVCLPTTIFNVGELHDRNKMLKRPKHVVFSETDVMENEGSKISEKNNVEDDIIDTTLQGKRHVDMSLNKSISFTSCERSGTFNNRKGIFDNLFIIPAKLENMRKSSFSSLYFSTLKPLKRKQSSLIMCISDRSFVDDNNNNNNNNASHAVQTGGALDDFMLTNYDEFSTGHFFTIGILETEEHVFLPRYELVNDINRELKKMFRDFYSHGGFDYSENDSFGIDVKNNEAILLHDSIKLSAVDETKREKKNKRNKNKKNKKNKKSSNNNNNNNNSSSSNSNNGLNREEDECNLHFIFGNIASVYTLDPTEEEEEEKKKEGILTDCKVAARLVFDGEKSVMLISTHDEVEKYIAQQPTNYGNFTEELKSCIDENTKNKEKEQEEECSRCTCTFAFITKHARRIDYSKCYTNKLYHHCVYCNRRPASFLCLNCLKSTCPSHVTQHYKECEAECTLFVNILDIMRSFDRIFWCEKCLSFTWKYTEVYDNLVDQLAITRGTYLDEAARDILCVGYDVRLREPHGCLNYASSHKLPMQKAVFLNSECVSSDALTSAFSFSGLPVSSCNLTHRRILNVKQEQINEQVSFTDAAVFFDKPGNKNVQNLSPVDHYSVVNISHEADALRVGEVGRKLVALGARVQGWRTTQEDAEAAFVIEIPVNSFCFKNDDKKETKKLTENNDLSQKSVAMAVFCVFDGHGGDAVAKLAARNFEKHLRKVVESRQRDDVNARALLFKFDVESSSLTAGRNEGMHVCRSKDFLSSCKRNINYTNKSGDHGEGVVINEVDNTKEMRRNSLGNAVASLKPLSSQVLPPLHTTACPETFGNNISANNVFRCCCCCCCAGGSDARLSCENYFGSCLSGSYKLNSDNVTVTISRAELETLRLYFSGIMEEALLSLDSELRLSPEGARGDYDCTGCTACIVGITTNFILCANVGDGGAAFYTQNDISRISVTHRITDKVEESRINAAGYIITDNRIEGLLAVSRALGDYDFKQCGGKGPKEQAVIAVPDVTIMPVPPSFSWEPTRWGVIVACDGVWDTATLHQVHYAIINTPNDLVVANSVFESVMCAEEMNRTTLPADIACPQRCNDENSFFLFGSAAGEMKAASLDTNLLSSAAGVFAQCVAPSNNTEGIGLDNCSLFLIEQR